MKKKQLNQYLRDLRRALRTAQAALPLLRKWASDTSLPIVVREVIIEELQARES